MVATAQATEMDLKRNFGQPITIERCLKNEWFLKGTQSNDLAYQSAFSSTADHIFLGGNPEYNTRNVELFEDIKYRASVNEFDSPNSIALLAADTVKSLLDDKNIDLNDYSPIEEGGIIYDFHVHSDYYQVEMYNDQIATLYIERDDSIPEAWDLTFDELYNKISEIG